MKSCLTDGSFCGLSLPRLGRYALIALAVMGAALLAFAAARLLPIRRIAALIPRAAPGPSTPPAGAPAWSWAPAVSAGNLLTMVKIIVLAAETWLILLSLSDRYRWNLGNTEIIARMRDRLRDLLGL